MANDERLTTTSMTVRRMKTYTGGQGYVYQYYFVGKRQAIANEPTAPATEYVFDVSSDRKTTFAVSVFLPEEALKAWVVSHGRVLSDAEQYGAIKMRLFRAFDEVKNMMTEGRRLIVDANGLEQATLSLGVD